MFAACRDEGRAALIGYLPAGFPDLAGSRRILAAMADAGCDLLEVGAPYSDPVMDGPTIQAAAEVALRAGTRLRDVLATVGALADGGARAVVMTYWNPVLRYGPAAFARDLASAGGLGAITPDLVPEEAADWLAATDEQGLDRVFLVAPSSTDRRIATTAAASRGFVYAASVMGVTGARDVVSETAPALVRRVRAATELPIGVGLGVRSAVQASQLAGFADGVIVGSAFVAAAGRGEQAVRELAGALAAGVRAPSVRHPEPHGQPV
jgi:tryptophan synthase alpha chain